MIGQAVWSTGRLAGLQMWKHLGLWARNSLECWERGLRHSDEDLEERDLEREKITKKGSRLGGFRR